MQVRLVTAGWESSEAGVEDSVGELGGLKEHDLGVACWGVSFFKDTRVKWLKHCGVKGANLIPELRVFVDVGWEGLIDRVITNHIRISSKAGGHFLPVINECILKRVGSIFVVDPLEQAGCLRAEVIVDEIGLLAIINDWVAILILRQIVVAYLGAEFHEGEHLIEDSPLAGVWHVCPFSIEIRHTLSANSTSEDVLVGIHESVDASLTKTVDELLNLVEIGIIVDSWRNFDSFPHDTQSHEVETPLCELLYFTIG